MSVAPVHGYRLPICSVVAWAVKTATLLPTFCHGVTWLIEYGAAENSHIYDCRL